MPLRPDRFGQFQHTVVQFNAYVPEGTKKETILDHRYWAHVAGQVKPYSEIRVICEDGSYYCRLLVVYKNGSDIRVKALEFHDLESVKEVDEEQEYFVKSRGAVHKWCVVRKADGENIKTGFATQEEALRELADYMRALGR